MWSGVKPKLDHLRPFGCTAYIHVNQGKLDPRAVKGVFIGYPLGVKGYKIWLINDKKCVISRNVIFQESSTIKTNMQKNTSSTKPDSFELEVENTIDHNSQGNLDETSDQSEPQGSPVTPRSSRETQEGSPRHTTEPVDQTHDSESETSQGSRIAPDILQEGGELSGYQLARDRPRREIKTPVRFAHADLIAYAFSIGESLDQEEPATFEEVCKSREKDSWMQAMKEEMASLHKNNTWKLVNKPT